MDKAITWGDVVFLLAVAIGGLILSILEENYAARKKAKRKTPATPQ